MSEQAYSPGKSHSISFNDFESLVEEKSILILEFWAEWCAPCKTFAPIYEGLANQFPEIFFAKVDTEKETELATAFQVRSIPTLIVFKNGEIVYEQPGIPEPKFFVRFLNELIQS